MKTLDKYKNEKIGLIDDMRAFITYYPNRENDLLAIMELYMKADSDNRPSILNDLRNCMDGENYSNPYVNSYRYTLDDINQFDKILNEYIDNLSGCNGDEDEIDLCVRSVTQKINQLNESCNQSLIDTWRRERLCNFINDAAKAAGMEISEDITYGLRMW